MFAIVILDGMEHIVLSISMNAYQIHVKWVQLAIMDHRQIYGHVLAHQATLALTVEQMYVFFNMGFFFQF